MLGATPKARKGAPAKLGSVKEAPPAVAPAGNKVPAQPSFTYILILYSLCRCPAVAQQRWVAVSQAIVPKPNIIPEGSASAVTNIHRGNRTIDRE